MRPSIILLLLDQLFLVPFLLVLLLDLFLKSGVVLGLFFGDFDHHLLNITMSGEALFKLGDLQGVQG